MKKPLFLIFFLGLATSVFAEHMTDVTAQTRTDILNQQKQLATLEENVVKERTTMALKISQLNDQIKELKKKLAQHQNQNTLQLAGKDAISSAIEKARGDLDFLQTIQEDYRQSFDTRLSAAEADALKDRLKRIDNLLVSKKSEEKLKVLKPLLNLSFERIESSIGGNLFAGKAIGQGGRILEGKFAKFGPVSYFSNSEGISGQVTSRTGEVLPSIQISEDPEQIKSIDALMSGAEATVPMDLSGGKAFEMAKHEETFWEHLQQGGTIIYPLLALALACILVTLYKVVSLSLIVSGGEEKGIISILKELKEGNVEAALSLADKLKRPLGPVIREGIEHRNLSKDHLEEILYERMLTQIPVLDRFLPALAVCASAAPLLGLLGTVTGMIHTFKLITVFGTGDASLLSSGISEALVTTEVGLVIAIPTLLIHAWLSRKVRRATAMTQRFAIAFVNGLKIRPDGQE